MSTGSAYLTQEGKALIHGRVCLLKYDFIHWSPWTIGSYIKKKPLREDGEAQQCHPQPALSQGLGQACKVLLQSTHSQED